MFDWIPDYLHSNISLFSFAAAIAAGAALAYFQYRQTVPPIDQKLRIFLGCLRGLAICLIVLMIFAPEITAVFQTSQTRHIALLVDQSASMGIHENGRSRMERALEISENLRSQINDKARLSIYAFDNDTAEYTTLNIDTTANGTNIGGSLAATLRRNEDLNAVIIVSDGNSTVGDNPVYLQGLGNVRIMTVGVGDTVDGPDLLISDVKKNRIVYQDKETTVLALISARGTCSQQVTIRLKQGNRLIQAKQVQLEGNGKTTEVPFTILPEEFGLHSYHFELDAIPEEVIRQNNRFSFTLDVLKGKVKVGILAALPDYESRFIRFLLEEFEDIDVRAAIQSKNGNGYLYPPRNVMDSLDVLVLCDYPVANRTDPQTERLLSQSIEKRIPVLFINGQRLTQTQRNYLQPFFPIATVKYADSEIETQVHPPFQESASPITGIFENREIATRFWDRLPPISYPYIDLSFKTEVQTLLETRESAETGKTAMPVLIANNAQGKRSLWLIGSGFWRWHFRLAEEREFAESWKAMLKNMIRWLDSKSANKNVILSTSATTYSVGETVPLSTEVYDGTFAPVNDALVRTLVQAPAASFEIESEFSRTGRYEGTMVPLTPGKYILQSLAWKNDIKIGEDKIELVVLPVDREFTRTRQDDLFLKRLADKTGGKYFHEKGAQDLVDELKLTPEIKQSTSTIELWNDPVMLMFIILLLSLEWIIRKRKGLA